MRKIRISNWQWSAESPFVLLALFLAMLWLAGGASRSDVLGQAMVRGTAWLLLMLGLLFLERPSLKGAKPVVWLLAAAIALPLLQLMPLPPGIWQALPGRDLFREAATVTGQAQPWRPWTIVPEATVNALSSLIVPVVTLLLIALLNEKGRSRLPGLLLCAATASAAWGLMQLSHVGVSDPLINQSAGEVSGNFANRNHFALFMAMGCLLAPAWAFQEGRRAGWRAPAALGLVLLFALLILASGSRAGLAIGFFALGIAMILAARGIGKELRGAPSWAFPALIFAIITIIALFVLISVMSDRAASITRVVAIDPGEDMRTQALPTLGAMIREYFPVGSGLGGFDPIFRIHEPLNLLKFSYFNHAHNDFLEIVLDAGLPGASILLAAIVWWLIASLRAWRNGKRGRNATAKLGSVMLLLIMAASLFDYPARTPLIMSVIVIAAFWLSGAQGAQARANFTRK